MEMPVRADVDLADRAGLRGAQTRGRVRDVLKQHNAALRVDSGEISRGAGAGIDNSAAHATRPRRARERMRDAVRRLRPDLDPGPTGKADIGVVLDELGPEAVGVKAGLEVAEALPLLLRSRQLHAAGEFLQVPHHGGSVDGATQGLDYRIGHHTILAARG